MDSFGPLKVARLPFLNVVPFFLDWSPELFCMVDAFPRQMAHRAAEGRVDAGTFPVVDCWRLEADFEPVENFGIAVRRSAGSVMLFSKRPIDRLAGASIGVTDQTSTSVRLLNLLLRERYGISVRLRRGFEPDDDARLLIGDSALQASFHGLPGFPTIIDLGSEWYAWRKMPFAFARWVVRKSAPLRLKRRLVQQLRESLSHFRRHRLAVVRAAALRLGLQTEAVGRYLDGLVLCLGKKELAAESLFRRFVEKNSCEVG